MQIPNTIGILAYLRYFDNAYMSDDVKTVFFNLWIVKYLITCTG